jgi:hypothetical protein
MSKRQYGHQDENCEGYIPESYWIALNTCYEYNGSEPRYNLNWRAKAAGSRPDRCQFGNCTKPATDRAHKIPYKYHRIFGLCLLCVLDVPANLVWTCHEHNHLIELTEAECFSELKRRGVKLAPYIKQDIVERGRINR